MTGTRFAVLGCGSIAQRAFLPAVLQAEGAVLAVVGSRSLEKAKDVCGKFDGDPVEGYDTAIYRDDVDAVYIVTPVGVHAELAIAASARAGRTPTRPPTPCAATGTWR